MKTYAVVAKCKATPDCPGMPKFGTTTAESLEALTQQLRNFSKKKQDCPACKQFAEYSYLDYLATPLE
jgi:hypothetical protein